MFECLNFMRLPILLYFEENKVRSIEISIQLLFAIMILCDIVWWTKANKQNNTNLVLLFDFQPLLHTHWVNNKNKLERLLIQFIKFVLLLFKAMLKVVTAISILFIYFTCNCSNKMNFIYKYDCCIPLSITKIIMVVYVVENFRNFIYTLRLYNFLSNGVCCSHIYLQHS